ncbi:MAG: 4-hydroxythreonine-4-phosphate dehydrogenase PdxA [Phycisphaerae bacterium]
MSKSENKIIFKLILSMSFLAIGIINGVAAHGTAFDISGKGVADESSMKAAIRLAIEMAKCKKQVGNRNVLTTNVNKGTEHL